MSSAGSCLSLAAITTIMTRTNGKCKWQRSVYIAAWRATTRLRDYATMRLGVYATTRLRDYATTRLRVYATMLQRGDGDTQCGKLTYKGSKFKLLTSCPRSRNLDDEEEFSLVTVAGCKFYLFNLIDPTHLGRTLYQRLLYSETSSRLVLLTTSLPESFPSILITPIMSQPRLQAYQWSHVIVCSRTIVIGDTHLETSS
jgi:hypothetical protein